MSEPIFLCKYCGADYGDIPHPMISCIRNLASQRDDEVRRAEEAETERDALREDAERLREAIDKFLSFQGSTREPEGQAALDAALAVQP